jgi:hypothetical protein
MYLLHAKELLSNIFTQLAGFLGPRLSLQAVYSWGLNTLEI